MLTRLIDFLKVNGITALFTALVSGAAAAGNDRRRRVLAGGYVDKRARPGRHWRAQPRPEHSEVAGNGALQPGAGVCGDRARHGAAGRCDRPTGIVTGASRLTQQLQEHAQALAAQQEPDRRDRELERRRRVLEANIANLRTEFESVEEELRQINSDEQNRQQTLASGHQRIAAANPPAETPARRRNNSNTQPQNADGILPHPFMADRKRRTETWELRLYVAGQTPKSVTAMANLKKYCEQHLKGRYKLEVIDLLVNPQLAEGDQILAIPTLVRKVPEPIRKIIGDLSNEERVLVGLDVRPAGAINPAHGTPEGTGRAPEQPAPIMYCTCTSRGLRPTRRGPCATSKTSASST